MYYTSFDLRDLGALVGKRLCQGVFWEIILKRDVSVI
jgi:hypothetical protein